MKTIIARESMAPQMVVANHDPVRVSTKLSIIPMPADTFRTS